jgi:hypothetical protein
MKKTNVCEMSEHRAGDEVMFQHAGLLSGRVERVRFRGGRPVYTVTATLTFEVPGAAVVGRESDILHASEGNAQSKCLN